ncbi:hypothetical protein BDZ97DRAFT_1905490 [Flammula alnicola]|nr:hypothetical protein BDZ97DRAFT_1905490 [Flammula alnicola]
MPSILNLKFKVASFLEQGQRLENLSWRLWHLQNLMVDTDNAKSKREFKKLSKCMGDKLDKEKGRSIEELEAPDFKRNHSTDMIKQRAIEKERNREASQNAQPGTIKRMQFTFSVDQPAQTTPSAPVKKPDTKPSAEFTKRTRAAVSRSQTDGEDAVMADGDSRPETSVSASTSTSQFPSSLHFPGLFSNDFGPSALLYAAPTLTTRMNYGEGFNPSGSNDQFSISRPTIELALDDLLFNDEPSSDNGSQFAWSSKATDDNTDSTSATNPADPVEKSEAVASTSSSAGQEQDVVMASVPAPPTASTLVLASATPSVGILSARKSSIASSQQRQQRRRGFRPAVPRTQHCQEGINLQEHSSSSQAVKDILPETLAPSRVSSIYGTRSSTPTGRPTLTLRTQTVSTSGSGLGNSAPGGVKAECSNCGATHTPLWRRGLNDELNATPVAFTASWFHKRPRPKSMRNSHGAEGRTSQVAPRPETVDVMVAAQCYNCHTTATPLWRKDDEGKTVCNACGLYYKLHGSARPISMKSDVIRKRSRHDARRTGPPEDTPSASPGVSRRTSPVREASPTLAPDSTTQMSYEFGEDSDFRSNSSSSELMGALGATTDTTQAPMYNPFQITYPGPYHPEYLLQLYSMPADALPFSSVESSDIDLALSPRSTKRRRMSTDSASEPPSSAVSFSSYSGDGYSSASSSTSHSKRSSMEFPFSAYNSNGSINAGPALRGSGNTFWHPPMMPQSNTDNDAPLFHPPINAGNDDSPMDYLHPPMALQDEESLFSTYLHPPMALPEEPAKGSVGRRTASACPRPASRFPFNHSSFIVMIVLFPSSRPS